MAHNIRRVDYFYTTVRGKPGQAYDLLAELSAGDVNLLAFNAVPMGPEAAQLTIFPESVEPLVTLAERTGLVLDGPHHALLVQGDDRLGALAEVHTRLRQANVNVFASSGVTDGKGSYGYILYVQREEIDRAASALGA